jgi:hypothetical protein
MTQLAPEDAAREQTVLAWRRTALRWVIVAVVAARFFSEEIGAPLIIFALVVIVGAAWLNLVVSREYSHMRSGAGFPAPDMPDALRTPQVRLGILAGATLVLCLGALAWVVTR